MTDHRNHVSIDRFVRCAWLAVGMTSLGTLAAGCSELNLQRAWPWSTAKSEKPKATHMTVAWTHATENASGRETRGFRGRIFFYPKETKAGGGEGGGGGGKKGDDPSVQKPMQVDGTLTVYAFDVGAKGQWGTAAPRKFVFKPDQLKKKCAESKQGPAYDVWLPWDGADGPPKEIDLLVRFDAAAIGPVLMSDTSRQLLPGISQVAKATPHVSGKRADGNGGGSVEQTGYQTADESTNEHKAVQHASAEVSGAGIGARAATAAAADDWWK